MLAIICPSCGNVNQLGMDDGEDVNYEICTRCGCNYEELEDDVEE